ncbi:MAG: hypothetical protein ABIG10_01770 [bacterium]
MAKIKRIDLKKYMPYIKEIFYVLGIALIIFAIMEIIKPRIVLAYININLILVLWLLSGIIVIINKDD